jgi:hypothetical protein
LLFCFIYAGCMFKGFHSPEEAVSYFCSRII